MLIHSGPFLFIFTPDMQLPPHISVQGLVKHYLVLSRQTSTQQLYRMFSDGNPGIVFHLKDQLLQWEEGNLIPQLQPRSFVYGQLSQYSTMASKGDLSMIVVVLQPHALFTHFHIPADELKDYTVPLVDLFGSEARDLEDQVISAVSVHRAIDCIEKFLSKKTIESSALSKEIAIAMNLISQQQGIISIAQLLQNLPITEKQLERKFREHIGISPKRFADTIKFQHFLKLLQKQPDKGKIAELIYASGYYDQAHLNHNFKRMTGLSPIQYKHSQQLLAINLMAV
ncbi:helix-turn-helix domain-containing protein [Pedobacter gandavensis]|uniref:AraC family transcriptional regulator n=1 Tax=Pedobacter TaxID=84567 RepID=UPI001C996F21|nr:MULTISPECIES: helix-turn-helix domain-containing protein [Pedobacter]WGQ10149.1 helix-turn-helix domain-containing protein [Pedobacter gandavensis]